MVLEGFGELDENCCFCTYARVYVIEATVYLYNLPRN